MGLEEYIRRETTSDKLLLVVIVAENVTLEEFAHGDDLGLESLGLWCGRVWSCTGPDGDSVAVIRGQSHDLDDACWGRGGLTNLVVER